MSKEQTHCANLSKSKQKLHIKRASTKLALEINMKIDYDLLRYILIRIENITDGKSHIRAVNLVPKEKRQNKEYMKTVSYHVCFLIDAKYITGSKKYWYNPYFSDITPKGHEFLSAIREDSIWHEVKDKIGTSLCDKGLSFVFDVAMKIGQSIILKGLTPG